MIIENMYEYILDHGEDFSPLTSLRVLQPGGAALSDKIVTALTAAGVNVKTTYGSTEIGPPFRSMPHTRDNPRCYTFRNLYPDSPYLKMEKVGEGLFECVVYKGFELAAEMWQDSDEPYRTNDLFIQNPPGSGFWVFEGRKDDILIHSNGENTSAGPLQLDIQTSCKVIHKALALGHSQPCVGLLVQIEDGHDPASDIIKNTVWDAVQKVNLYYPLHSQIMRSMIRILPYGSVLPVTPKGNVRRKEAERLYVGEISHLFSNLCLAPHTITNNEPLSESLRNTFSSLSNVPATEISDNTTLYELGIDSRLALSLRSIISAHLQRPISLGAIFENPDISSLIQYIEDAKGSSTSDSANKFSSNKPSPKQTIDRIISTLSSEILTCEPLSLDPTPVLENAGETILLTGASGSLGTALLESLAGSEHVRKIYAMVRGPDHRDKLYKALESRGMDPSILENGKIEILNFSMQDPLLGVHMDIYHKLAMNVTTVIQNAWKMNFNVGVEYFVDDCLKSMYSTFFVDSLFEVIMCS
jgi:hypothetical protein